MPNKSTSALEKKTFSLKRARRKAWRLAWKDRIAQFVIKKLYGKEMHLSPFPKGTIACAAVFWYFEHGMRKYVMARDMAQAKPQVRFVGCIDNVSDMPIDNLMMENVRQVLGDGFARSLSKDAFAKDDVASAPQFKYEDINSGEKLPVQCICWAIQITPEQAELAAPQVDNMEILSVPEFTILNEDVAESHKLIYQSVLKTVNKKAPTDMMTMLEELESMPTLMESNRTIH